MERSPDLPGAASTAAVVVAVVVAVTVGTAAVATRRIGERAICQQLRFVKLGPSSRAHWAFVPWGRCPSESAWPCWPGGNGGLSRLPPSRSSQSLIAVLGSSISSVAGAVGHDPAVWGFRFDYEVQLPVGDKEAPALAEARHLPGVASVSSAYFGAGRVPGKGSTGQIRLVSPGFFAPHREHGSPLTGPYQVEVGQELAHLVSPSGTLPMTVGGRTVLLHVVGVVQDLFDRAASCSARPLSPPSSPPT